MLMTRWDGVRVAGRTGRSFSLIAPIAVLMLVQVLSSLVTVSPAAARLLQAPNSRVMLELPPGYEPAELFSGFQNEALGVSYVILEVPAKAYAEMADGFAAEKLATRGVRDVVKGHLPRSDEHVYMRGRQSSPAGDYAKFFVLFKGADLAVLVSANVPQNAVDSGAIKSEDIERVLASARVTHQQAVRDLYQLSDLGSFKAAGRVAGTSRLYTLDGRMEPERKGQIRPTFIVAPSLDRIAVANSPELAAHLLQTLTSFKSLKLGAPRKVTIGGLDGTEIEAEGLHEQDGTPMRVYQVVLTGRQGGYFRMIGFAREGEEAARLIPQFRRMAASFQLLD